MAQISCPYEIGEIVIFKTLTAWVAGIISNIRAPLGFRQFDVLEMDTGKSYTASRHELEKVQAFNFDLADDISDELQPTALADDHTESH